MEKARILICDDEQGVRESLKLILGGDYSLEFATNGEEAITSLKSRDADLLILDIKMPKLNGLEALRRIKKIKPHIRILIISGYESIDVAAQALKLGAEDYLAKPFERQQVLSKVRAILGA